MQYALSHGAITLSTSSRETLHCQFLIFHLAARLLRYDSKHPFLVNPIIQAAQYQGLLFPGELGELTTSNHRVIRVLTLFTLWTI
jgi:hypothetical protein